MSTLTARHLDVIYTIDMDIDCPSASTFTCSSERPGATSRILLKFHGMYATLQDAKDAAQVDSPTPLIWS